MIRKFALCLHDIKVSGNEASVEMIRKVMTEFDCPLTVHVIIDTPLDKSPALSDFIEKKLKGDKIEIVFHGLTHLCSRKVYKHLAFYHKYQAEYLVDSDDLRNDTERKFRSLIPQLGNNIGICPPCWLVTKTNFKFFKTLNPLYIETLLAVHYGNEKVFSPVISLGSPNNFELVFLKLLGKLMLLFSLMRRNAYLRVAIHTCDLAKAGSMTFFQKIIKSIFGNRFQTVFLKDLHY
jgi:hypothetical protein